MACFGEDVWKPVAHLEVLSDEVHQLDLSRVYLFLLTAHLYTTFGMASDNASKKVGIKNIVICDDQFFSNGDSQKILDGNFKVFGKVAKIQKRNPSGVTTLSTQNIYESLSQLDRNKLLKRITPQALEIFEAGLKRVLDKIKMSTDFDLILKGEAIKVIPIAIYI